MFWIVKEIVFIKAGFFIKKM